MSEFRRNYRNAVDSFGGSITGRDIDAYAVRVEKAVEDVIAEMGRLADNQKGVHYAKGDVAEAWHAERSTSTQRDVGQCICCRSA